VLESYFIRPETVDRISSSWLHAAIEKYIAWLESHSYSARCVIRRVPLVVQFGAFARKRGAVDIDELPSHLDAFVRHRHRVRRGHQFRSSAARRQFEYEIRGPIEQFYAVAKAAPPESSFPFIAQVPGFFDYLQDERGLSATTIESYRGQLARFEHYIASRQVELDNLSPTVLDGFIAELRTRISAQSLGVPCTVLRVFLRYLFRQRIIGRNLSAFVEGPRTYTLSDVPRSIGAADVERMLSVVERRSVVGRRDYALLLLLVVYGLRAREVAALTLDDFDWRGNKLHVRCRKAGRADVYPLAPEVGEAVLDYLRRARPTTRERRVFLRVTAPRIAVTHQTVSRQVRVYLGRAGIAVPRPGSHTLRHSCAQRLVDAEFSLKVVGDFLGHKHAASTRIYSKVAIEALREVALGDGEAVL
jgi:integrase/recombinase XerD